MTRDKELNVVGQGRMAHCVRWEFNSGGEPSRPHMRKIAVKAIPMIKCHFGVKALGWRHYYVCSKMEIKHCPPTFPTATRAVKQTNMKQGGERSSLLTEVSHRQRSNYVLGERLSPWNNRMSGIYFKKYRANVGNCVWVSMTQDGQRIDHYWSWVTGTLGFRVSLLHCWLLHVWKFP